MKDVMSHEETLLQRNLMNRTRVACRQPDCDWKGLYGARDVHDAECPYKMQVSVGREVRIVNRLM